MGTVSPRASMAVSHISHGICGGFIDSEAEIKNTCEHI